LPVTEEGLKIMPEEFKVQEVVSRQEEAGRGQRVFTFKATELIWLLLGILEGLIAIRIGLKLIGANPGSLIVAMIYGLTNLFLFPFAGMVPSPTYGNMELELSSMFAMLIYGLMGWAFERLVWVIFYRPRGPVVGMTQTTTSEHRRLQ
jgi:hypothetical protein